MIHVLILLECVLLVIIGLGEFVRSDRTEEAATPGIESGVDAQANSMHSGIVPVAAAAGPDIIASGTPEVATRSVFAGWPRGEALSQPEWQYPDVLGSALGSSGAMREADRRAIARDLLGAVYDRVVPREPFGASEVDVDGDAIDASLPRPTKANRPKTPQQHVNVLSTQPIARPGVLTAMPRGEAMPLYKLRAATSSDAAQEGVPVSAKTAEVQRLLTRLGYQIGDVDGVFGNRTENAIRSFQKREGNIVDGRISDNLIARLRREAIRQGGAERSLARRSGYTPPPPEDGGWLGSVVASYQRFVGHNFNSVARPGELQSYCRLQSDTWVFDEGSRRFLHCGQVTASK